MNRIETLAELTTRLANHVGAVIRLSNELDAIFRDGVREDVNPATRLAVLERAKTIHDAFRAEHFRDAIASVNGVVKLVDELYQEEPVTKEEEPEPLPIPDGIPPEVLAKALGDNHDNGDAEHLTVELADIKDA